MNILFIGGSGNISSAVSKLAISRGIHLTLLNRGNTTPVEGASVITADMGKSNDAEITKALGNRHFDCVVNWIAFDKADVDRDIRLFSGRTGHYIFISSASVYQKPPTHPIIDESTPLKNPYWDYSRNKIACEERLMSAYREHGFPATIVRPSLTYNTLFPLALGGWGCWTLADRILNNKEIVVHGDGTSLWTVTHAEDFARGFVPLMGNHQAIGHPFHITSDELLTWNQIYQIIGEALGKKSRIVNIPTNFIVRHFPDQEGSLLGDKAHSAIFDNRKIKRFVPGFEATIPFREGVQKTINWFNADPVRKVINPQENAMLDTLLARWQQASAN